MNSRLIACAVAIVTAITLYLVLEYTRLGKALRAAADNPTAATYMGIDVDRDLDSAQTKLDDLWVRAAWKEAYEARADVLQRVVLARSALFEKRGRRDAAIDALEGLTTM